MILLCQLSFPCTHRVEQVLSSVKLDLFVCQKLNFQRPNHSVYCFLAQLLERAQVSKFRFFPWLGSSKCPSWTIHMAIGPTALSSHQLPQVCLQGPGKSTRPDLTYRNPTVSLQSHPPLFKDRATPPTLLLDNPSPPPCPPQLPDNHHRGFFFPTLLYTSGSPSLITQLLYSQHRGTGSLLFTRAQVWN